MASKVEILTGSLKGTIIGNAASEETLQEILKALQSTTSTGQQSQGQTTQATRSVDQFSASVRLANAGLSTFGSALGNTSRLLTTGSTSLGEWTKGLSSALNHIPGVGKYLGGLGSMLGSGIQVIEGWNRTLKTVSSSGASFNNSITEMRNAAASAKMTLDEFQTVILANTQGFANMGGTVTEGARSFTMLAGEVMKAGGVGEKLMNMGFSVEDINGGMARYLTTVHRGTKVNSENVGVMSQKYAEYATHLDKISKLTGENRAELEKANDAIKQEAAWKLKLATASVEEREKMTRALDSARAQFGETGAQYMKDMIINGQAMQESSRIFASTIPAGAATFDKAMHDIKDKSVSATEFTKRMEDNHKANASAITAQVQGIQHVANALSGGVSTSMGAFPGVISDVSTSILRYSDKDGKATEASVNSKLEAAAAEQAARDKLTVSLNATEIGFRNLHAAIMGQVLQGLDKFVNSLNISGSSITNLFNNIVEKISTASLEIEGAFNKISDFVEDNLFPILAAAGVAVGYLTASIMSSTATLIASMAKAAMGMLVAMGPIGLAAAGVVAAVAGIAYIFKKAGGDVEVFKLALAWLGASIKQVSNGIVYAYHWIMNKLTTGDYHKKQMEQIDKENIAIEKDKATIRAEIDAKMAQNRAKAESEDLEKKKKRTERDEELEYRRQQVKEKEVAQQARVKEQADAVERRLQSQTAVPSSVNGSQKEFYDKMYNTLLEQAKKQGVANPEAIARLGSAQSALETGYGKHTAGGNNYFGIKAKNGDTSPGQETKEFINGKWVTITDKFRRYNSMEESAADYVKFLQENKRYKGVLGAKSAEDAIIEQGKTGYATDPEYVKKLQSIHAAGTGNKLPTKVAESQAAPVQKTTQMPSGADLARQEAEKKQREKEEAERQRVAAERKNTSATTPQVVKEEKSLSDVVSVLDGVNSKLAALLDQNRDLGEKQIRSIKANGDNVYAT